MKIPIEFAKDLSLQAGNLLVNQFHSGNIVAAQKADTSIVTESDILADELITRIISQAFPHDIILSEELNANFDTQGEAVWIVDPLDGTTNFSLGLQYWGVSIARLVHGYLECAALYFPLLNELYTAVHKQGAYLNGKQIHTIPPNPQLTSAFFSCCSRTYRFYDVSIPYKARILGSAAYTFCAVARGIAVLGFEATPKIWDIAGGWLIACEAGGAVETLEHNSVFPLNEILDYSRENFPTIVAATADMLPKAHSQINKKNGVN